MNNQKLFNLPCILYHMLDCIHISSDTFPALGCHPCCPLSHSSAWPHIFPPLLHHNFILRRNPCLIESHPPEMHKIEHLQLRSSVRHPQK